MGNGIQVVRGGVQNNTLLRRRRKRIEGGHIKRRSKDHPSYALSQRTQVKIPSQPLSTSRVFLSLVQRSEVPHDVSILAQNLTYLLDPNILPHRRTNSPLFPSSSPCTSPINLIIPKIPAPPLQLLHHRPQTPRIHIHRPTHRSRPRPRIPIPHILHPALIRMH